MKAAARRGPAAKPALDGSSMLATAPLGIGSSEGIGSDTAAWAEPEGNFWGPAEQARIGERIGVPEPAALRNGWIAVAQLERVAASYGDNDYGRYLQALVAGG